MIYVAFSYTKLITSRVLAVANNRRVSITSINEYDFNVKESVYFLMWLYQKWKITLIHIFLEESFESISGPLRGAILNE